jgi:dolichyl-phosphate beta-glucosyltransferase
MSSNNNPDLLFAPAKVELTVVVPAYNEEKRLPSMLEEAYSYLSSRRSTFEILVVDDGSKDGTASFVREFSAGKPEIRLLSYGGNRGKGFAVRYGMHSGVGERLIFSDADGSSPMPEIERLEKAMSEGAAVAIGSRALLSEDTAVKARWYRKVPGRIFATLVNVVLLPGLKDTQCGFKMFTREAARFIFPRQTAERFSFDPELLYLARYGKFKIAEVPINWHNVDGSKVNMVADSAKMAVDTLRFRIRGLCGKYKRP